MSPSVSHSVGPAVQGGKDLGVFPQNLPHSIASQSRCQSYLEAKSGWTRLRLSVGPAASTFGSRRP